MTIASCVDSQAGLSRLSSLRDAARQGDAAALRRLIAAVDPAAAAKVDAVLKSQRQRRLSVAISSAAVVQAAAKKVLLCWYLLEHTLYSNAAVSAVSMNYVKLKYTTLVCIV